MLFPHADFGPLTLNSNAQGFQILRKNLWHNLEVPSTCLFMIAGTGLVNYAPFICRKYGLSDLQFNPAFHRIAVKASLKTFDRESIRVSSALGGMPNVF